MTRPAHLAIASLLLVSWSGATPAAVRYAGITGSTAGTANACPAWVLEGSHDDCSYHAGAPSGLGVMQWIGPVFGAGHYAPGMAPPVYVTPLPDPGPVLAPAAVLPTGGKTGIPITRGFISIDDRDSPAVIDDVIGGTIEFGAFERNVGIGPTSRHIESIGRVIHRLVPARVSSATPNASGGIDYVVAQADGGTAFPTRLSGTTSAGGGFADQFPSEVASQSSADAGDEPYWAAPGAYGLATFEGDSAAIGTRSSATVWGYSCDDGDGAPGPAGCLTGGLNWDGDSRAAFGNVLLRISTNSDGDIVEAEAFLVNEADQSVAMAGLDSWSATTLGFAGPATTTPAAFDDRNVLVISTVSPGSESVTTDVLANDVPGTAPVTVEIVTPPAAGTATVTTTPPNRIQYQRGSTPEGEQVIVYRITDDNDLTATAELHILVTDPLTCTSDVAEGARNSTTTVDVLANDEGFDLPPVTVTLRSFPDTGTSTVNPDRSISYTPPADTGGRFTIGYRLADGSGRIANCTLQVHVPALPQALDDTVGAAVDTATSIDVLTNDLEISDTPLTLAVVTAPQHGTTVVDTAQTLPRIRYTPAAGYLGSDTFTYTITDADADTSAPASVAVTVFGAPQTDAPACTADTATTDPGVPVTVDVLANDSGLNALPLVVEVTGVSPSAAGSAVVEADNRITFTPAAGHGGGIMVGYRAREALNNPVMCVLTVTIDDQPVATDNRVDALNFGQIVLIPVLGNDSGLADRPLTLAITAAPAHGTARVCTEPSADCPGVEVGDMPLVVYRYDDAAGYPAVDTFRYRVTDADGDASGEATVTIVPRNVLTANDDPDNSVTFERDFRTASGTTSRFDVLFNDGGLLRGPITLTIEPGSTGGSARVNADSTVTFTAKEDFIGLANFTYRITDADGATDTATVTVAVYPAQENDSGGSALDGWSLLLLAVAFVCRRRRVA